MKCSTHHEEATAICAHCGRAVCSSCSQVTSSQRTACSDTCAQALAKADRAIDTILGRGIQMARASAYGCYLCGGLLVAFAIYAHRSYPQIRLAQLLAGVMGLALIVFGIWYHRAARKEESP
jgi:hypothetical protein